MPEIKKASKEFYDSVSRTPLKDELTLGCMQRIADACETMAKSKEDLESEIEKQKTNYGYMRNNRDYYQSEYERVLKSRNAYKGLYLKLKNK